MRKVAAAAIILAASALVTACGSTKSASPAALRSPPTGAYQKFADGIERACLERRNELHGLKRPQTKAEFADYIATLLNIARYYHGQLAALHPAYRAGERATFTRYMRLLRADEASAVTLLKAVRRSDRRAVLRVVALERRRSAVEQRLMSRLGVSCY
jgi:hypothetical protein